MERRYKLMSAIAVRNLAGYNQKVREAIEKKAAAQAPVHAHARQPRGARAAAAARGGDRRARRPHDGRGQEGRGADRAPRAEVARVGHPPDARHAAPVRGRDHRSHQGERAHAHRVPGLVEGRFAHHPRPAGRREPAGAGRHALPRRPAAACPRACTAPTWPMPRCTASSRRSRSRARRSTSTASSTSPEHGRRGLGRGRGVSGESRSPLRPGGADRAAEQARLDLARAAAPAHRLQPRRAPDRGHGEGGPGHAHGVQRQPRDHRSFAREK